MSGTLHYVWSELTHDISVISSPMGTYPSFAFTPDDSAIIVWAAGALWNVPLSVNYLKERVAGGTPWKINWAAKVEKRIAETIRPETDLVREETKEERRHWAFKELAVDESGSRVAFQAAGVTYVQDFPSKDSGSSSKSKAVRVPVTQPSLSYYSPSFVPHLPHLVLHARWSTANFTTFELSSLTSGKAYELTGLPVGRYFAPVLCQCTGPNRRIAFVRLGGDLLTGDVVATAGAGIYIGDFTIPSEVTEHTTSRGRDDNEYIPIRNAKLITADVDLLSVKLRFLEGAKFLLVQQSDRAFTVNLAAPLDAKGDYVQNTIARGKMSVELAAAPRLPSVSTPFGGSFWNRQNADISVDFVAFVELFNIYVAPGKGLNEDGVWSKPGNATKGLARVGLDGGHDITWSGDGKTLFWLLGK